MKKKIFLPLVLLAAAILSLCACGEKPAGGTSASLDKTTLELGVGGSDTLTLTWDGGEPAPGEDPATTYIWTSSDEAVVTVAASGNTATVNGVAEGSATVTVSQGEKQLASCSVTVKASRLSVTVPEGKLVLRKNATVTVKVKGTEELDGDIVWESSDTSIGTVESQGAIARVTAVARGECVIRVRCGSDSAEFTLIVGLN